jgi:dolichol-phosphate mannosyltransferase
MAKKLVTVVVPMYNEEPMVPHFLTKIAEIIKENDGYNFEVVAVNDGSRDNTLALLYDFQKKYKFLRVVNLSRNFGHEAAVAAGLSVAKGDAIIPIDADLQDPPELIKPMLELFEEGYDVVNARRASRKEDTWIKRYTAGKFYKIIDKLSGKVRIPQNVGHYRLISRRVLDEVLKLPESNRVFRVEVPYVGFKTAEVAFVRPKREHGKTHYNMKSMIDLAINAITITSTKPLNFVFKFAMWLGIIFGLSAVTQLVLFILEMTKVLVLPFLNHGVWLLINVSLFLTTVILLALTIISIYLGKTFNETQKRPFYVIESVKENK